MGNYFCFTVIPFIGSFKINYCAKSFEQKLSCRGQVEPFNVASSANTTSGELYVVTSFYDRRIEELANEVQYLEGRAVYYENEVSFE